MQAERTLHSLSKIVLILGTLAISCVLRLAAVEPSKHSKTKPATQAQSVPVCQSPTVKAGQASLAIASTHTIILSWNASVPSPAHGKADGYCLYRSSTQGDALLENKCSACELLNPTPLSSTTCVDNAVTDGPTYYYAVAAVDAAGMSGPSNETSASIRTDKPATSPPKGISFCNGTTPSEKSDNTTKK